MAQVRTASQMNPDWGSTKSVGSPQGWYKQQTVALLKGLHEEIDPTALEELQIWCTQLNLDQDVMSQLLSTKDLTQVLHILLAHNGNQLHQLIIDLNKSVPQIIKDLKPEVSDKLLWLSQTAVRENIDVGNIHGREETMHHLMSFLDFKEDNDVKLINICGMPGIGKSFLVKHLRKRLGSTERNVFYINASGVTLLEDLRLQIFEQSRIPISFSSSDDVMRGFLDFLLLNKSDTFVLIIDDLSGLLDPSNKSCRALNVLEFLNDIMLKMFQSSIKLKMVVTSQSLFMIDESSEQPLLVPIKKKMKEYTRDLPLSKLPDSDAVKFLGPSLQNLSEHHKRHLVRQCDGHPLSLHLMSELASADFTPTTEVTHISSEDVEQGVDTLLLELFEKAFNKLSAENKKVLFAVVLFDLSAPLRALHYITQSSDSFDEFSERSERDFDSGFWVRMQKVPTQRDVFVVLHHPLIKKFLAKKMTNSSLEDKNFYLMLKKRYVTFYMNKLIGIGKECVPEQPCKSDFVRKSCSKFLQDQLNFKKALHFIRELKDPFILFTRDFKGVVMRSPSDVAHLFLCLCQFHDWFNGTLLDTLSKLLHEDCTDVIQYRLLTQTLYGAILAIGHNWDDLDEFLKPHNKHVDAKCIIATSKDLFYLCKALQAFASGALYVHKLKVKEVGLESLIEKKDAMLDEAMKKLNLKHLGADWKRVRMYFAVYVSLLKADSVGSGVETSVSSLQAAYSICYQAKSKYISQVAILEPIVYTALAKYKSSEGHLFKTNPDAASERYSHSASFFKEVSNLLRAWKMENSVVAARNYDSYASVMRSWGFVLVKAKSDERSEDATNMFIIAKEIGARAISIWEHKTFCSTSTSEILTAYVNQASVFTNLAKYHHRRPRGRTVNRLKYSFQMQALKFYGEAYSLLKEDYRKCHLIVGDWRLNKLTLQLPFFMDCARNPPESIDKVKANLREVEEAVRSTAHQQLTLSGSEVYASTSDDYESRSSDDMECEETTTATTSSTAGVTSLSSHNFRDVGSTATYSAHESKKRKL
ncbi:uncharacterized protein [Watersipora subatra]|uniref:uncharacterized protein n=1 Tax=Watersipora subatra TaxID=2589382 RepID=UPI00355C96F2